MGGGHDGRRPSVGRAGRPSRPRRHDPPAALPDDAILTTDAGSFGSWLARGFRFRRPGTFLGPTSGAMGYGLPAAIAAGLVHRDRTVVALVGDGGLGMTVAELETAVRHGLRTIVARLRQRAVRHDPIASGPAPRGSTAGTDLGPVDWAAVARGFGAHGTRIDRDEAFAPALPRRWPPTSRRCCTWSWTGLDRSRRSALTGGGGFVDEGRGIELVPGNWYDRTSLKGGWVDERTDLYAILGVSTPDAGQDPKGVSRARAGGPSGSRRRSRARDDASAERRVERAPRSGATGRVRRDRGPRRRRRRPAAASQDAARDTASRNGRARRGRLRGGRPEVV